MRSPHSPFRQPFNKYTPLFVLSYLQTSSLCLQQIANVLIVYLQVAGSDHEGRVHVGSALYVSEYLLHGSGYNAPLRIILVVLEALHGVSLARACLAIGEDSRIVALEDGEHSWSGCAVVYMRLGRVWPVHIVEGKLVTRHYVWVLLDVSLSTIVSNFST